MLIITAGFVGSHGQTWSLESHAGFPANAGYVKYTQTDGYSGYICYTTVISQRTAGDICAAATGKFRAQRWGTSTAVDPVVYNTSAQLPPVINLTAVTNARYCAKSKHDPTQCGISLRGAITSALISCPVSNAMVLECEDPLAYTLRMVDATGKPVAAGVAKGYLQMPTTGTGGYPQVDAEVCMQAVTPRAMQAACRQLGWAGVAQWGWPAMIGVPGRSAAAYDALSAVRCTGNTSLVNDCEVYDFTSSTSTATGRCRFGLPVAVRCTNDLSTADHRIGTFRLAGVTALPDSPTLDSGILQYFWGGTWVRSQIPAGGQRPDVCLQMGYEQTITERSISYISDTTPFASALTASAVRVSSWGGTSCSDGSLPLTECMFLETSGFTDAQSVISCGDKPQSLQLPSTSNPGAMLTTTSSGFGVYRRLMNYNSTQRYYRLCPARVYSSMAQALCEEMGFASVEAYGSSSDLGVTASAAPNEMLYLDCTRQYSSTTGVSLSYCTPKSLQDSYLDDDRLSQCPPAQASEPLALRCSHLPVQDDVTVYMTLGRLTYATAKPVGGRYGAVCLNSTRPSQAQLDAAGEVMCRSANSPLGLVQAISWSAWPGAPLDSQNVAWKHPSMTNLVCAGTEARLGQCSYAPTPDETQCNEDNALVVLCGGPSPPPAQAVSLEQAKQSGFTLGLATIGAVLFAVLVISLCSKRIRDIEDHEREPAVGSQHFSGSNPMNQPGLNAKGPSKELGSSNVVPAKPWHKLFAFAFLVRWFVKNAASALTLLQLVFGDGESEPQTTQGVILLWYGRILVALLVVDLANWHWAADRRVYLPDCPANAVRTLDGYKYTGKWDERTRFHFALKARLIIGSLFCFASFFFALYQLNSDGWPAPGTSFKLWVQWIALVLQAKKTVLAVLMLPVAVFDMLNMLTKLIGRGGRPNIVSFPSTLRWRIYKLFYERG